MAENLDINKTIQAWADITIQRWETRVVQLHIIDTGTLLKSFTAQVVSSASGSPEKITFAFEYYGRFIDIGVGKGITASMVGNGSRRAKPWYSRTFYRELQRMRELMEEKYGRLAEFTIVRNIEDNSDLGFNKLTT